MCVIKIHAFTSIGRPPSWSGTHTMLHDTQGTFGNLFRFLDQPIYSIEGTNSWNSWKQRRKFYCKGLSRDSRDTCILASPSASKKQISELAAPSAARQKASTLGQISLFQARSLDFMQHSSLKELWPQIFQQVWIGGTEVSVRTFAGFI